jgi:hypothetical protein
MRKDTVFKKAFFAALREINKKYDTILFSLLSFYSKDLFLIFEHVKT